MSIREESREYRAYMLRHLKKKYRDGRPPAVLEAEKVIAQYREEYANAQPQIARLETEECPPLVCFKCFWIKGKTFHLTCLTGDDEVDKFVCPNCRTPYEQPA